jgi:membrane protein implicated in regulation of membrane protease activity
LNAVAAFLSRLLGVSEAHLGWLLSAAFAAILILIVIARAVRRSFRSWRATSRGKAAHRSEKAAAQLLEREGYRVVDSQIRTFWQVRIDGEPHEIEIRADHLVEAGGQRYIAEVKTGAEAPQITTAATRRQLLEYRCAYEVDGILLVDMQRLEIRVVEFQLPDDSS